MKFKFIPAVIAIMGFLVFAYTLVRGTQLIDEKSDEIFGRNNISTSWKLELPGFAQKTGRVAEAYIFAAHASECKLCNDITLEARDLLMTGDSLKEVRKKIDDRYYGRGAGTNTPLPP